VLYARQLSEIQGRFAVINASASVRKVLELAGLDTVLLASTAQPAGSAPSGQASAASLGLAEPGATAEVFELNTEAALRVYWPGNPTAWFEGRAEPEAFASVEFSANVIGIGLGALVSGEASNAQSPGEFLAAAGAAVAQPADGSHRPDYMLLQGALTPAMKVAYGMLGCGGFQRLLRFDKGPQQASLPLSSVVKACLDAVGGEALGLVMVAETASLIGAFLQKAPSPQAAAPPPLDFFAFPQIRDWLNFTSEAAFANSTCLVVGFAAAQSRRPAVPLLKPLTPAGEIYGHFHAAAFPYRPLRKGRMDLAETVQPLFDSEQVLGLLHLLNDWRELSGSGESRFLRGACWCAPLSF
jgi:hypothetical protein